MLIKVVGSSSAGNCYIITSDNGNQLILECGIKYESILKHIDFYKLQSLFITHKHLDHSREKQKFILAGVDTYDHENLTASKIQNSGNFSVLPIPVKHGTEPTFSYIIKDNPSNKKILFCTDLEEMPKISDTKFDVMMLECNWSGEKIDNNAVNDNINNKGFLNHLSLEQVLEFLDSRENKPKILILCHISNSGSLDLQYALKECRKRVKNTYVAKPNLEINI